MKAVKEKYISINYKKEDIENILLSKMGVHTYTN
jgi:hypothetical protein